MSTLSSSAPNLRVFRVLHNVGTGWYWVQGTVRVTEGGTIDMTVDLAKITPENPYSCILIVLPTRLL